MKDSNLGPCPFHHTMLPIFDPVGMGKGNKGASSVLDSRIGNVPDLKCVRAMS